MKAIDVINEVLDEIAEAAVLHPQDNGNVKALTDRIKRDVASLPEWANVELDDDEEDDDTGVDADDLGVVDVQEKDEANKSDADEGSKSGKSGLKGKGTTSK